MKQLWWNFTEVRELVKGKKKKKKKPARSRMFLLVFLSNGNKNIYKQKKAVERRVTGEIMGFPTSQGKGGAG